MYSRKAGSDERGGGRGFSGWSHSTTVTQETGVGVLFETKSKESFPDPSQVKSLILLHPTQIDFVPNLN